jgi:uncharacterized membrane protein YgcG
MRFSLRILLMLIILVSLCCKEGLADTGTYQILDYRVKLIPKSDGTVQIEYFQRWVVTGGGIPWITVGMPNSNFSIVPGSKKGNAWRVYAANEGGWSGVRIDLDRNYQPYEKFEVGFTVTQSNLFYAEKDNYRLEFYPGWYDRAAIELLQVEVFFYAKLDTLKYDPKPTRIEGQSMIWERKNLSPGERFKISVTIPKTFMSGKIAIQKKLSIFSKIPLLFIIYLIFFIVLMIVSIRHRFSDSYGSGPRIFYGGHGSGSGGRKSGGIFSGGGGGFGGRSFSCVCACACAGCACACACAGGGAAGCERKISHRCTLCKQCKIKDRCPVWKGISL